VCGEFDELGYEVVEEIDALNGDVELRWTILRDLFKSVEYGLISASAQKSMARIAHLNDIHVLRSFSSSQSFQGLWPPSRLFRSQKGSNDSSNSLSNHLILILQTSQNSTLDICDGLFLSFTCIILTEITRVYRVLEK